MKFEPVPAVDTIDDELSIFIVVVDVLAVREWSTFSDIFSPTGVCVFTARKNYLMDSINPMVLLLGMLIKMYNIAHRSSSKSLLPASNVAHNQKIKAIFFAEGRRRKENA